MAPRLPIALLLLLCAGCSLDGAGFGEQTDVGSNDLGIEVDSAGPQREVGETCDGPMDCVTEAMCIGSPSGLYRCMGTCPAPYEICSDGAVCLSVTSQDAAICYLGGEAAQGEQCVSNLDCAPGSLCFGAAGQYYCSTACTTDMTCAPGSFCQRLDTGAGLCRAAIGAACTTTEECRQSTVCSADDPELAGLFPAGYCTSNCTADCPSGSVCRTVPGTSRTICLSTCEQVSDCRFNGGYLCLDAAECSNSSDPGACRNLFGEDSLCVPGPF